MAEPVRFGRYTVTRVLERGALGVVYQAREDHTGRDVTIKAITTRASRSDDDRRDPRLDAELRAACELQHPGIVEVYEVGRHQDRLFVAMEHVSSESLETRLAAGVELSIEDVVAVTVAIGTALDHAHDQGVVHREVATSTIMVADDGRYKLADFGVSLLRARARTRDGGPLAGPTAISPEQLRGRPATGASDQFLLGVVVYRLLTGERPFHGESLTTIHYQIAHFDPPSPSAVNPRVSRAVSEVVLRALDKDPARRFATCREFARALDAARSTGRADARSVTPPPPAATGRPRSSSGAAGDRRPPVVDAGASGADLWDVPLRDETTVEDHDDLGHPAPGAGLPVPAGHSRRFTAMVTLVVVGLVGGWALWLAGAFGPTRIEAALEVDSDPPDQGLAVWVDGQPLGRVTPTTVQLDGEEGAPVRVDLVRDDEVVASTALTLGSELPGRWAPEVAVPVRPVRYEVRSEPTGARVRLDGQAIARPTPVHVDLFPGQSYEIAVELDGYHRSTRTVDPAALDGSDTTLDFELSRIIRPGRLEAAAGTSVTIVAEPAEGGDPLRASGPDAVLELPPGRYDVTVRAPEIFFSGETDVTLQEGQTVQLPELPDVARVLVFDVPGNATVRIDDFDAFPSGGPRTVSVGPHRFVFRWPSGEEVVRDVTVERDGQEVSARRP